MPVLGSNVAQPVHWLRTGLSQARRVARIDLKDDHYSGGIGFGLLIEGATLRLPLNGLPLLLTCAHVVDWGQRAIAPSDLTIVFEGMFEDATARMTTKCLGVVLQSPVDEFDYALLVLDRWPGKAPPAAACATTA